MTARFDKTDKFSIFKYSQGLLSENKDESPVTGTKTANQLCYWFNNTYVRKIVESRLVERNNQ